MSEQLELPTEDKTRVGDVYGKLTVIEAIDPPSMHYGNHAYWLCRCTCGIVRGYRAGNLRSGNSTSCGCGKPGKGRGRKK